MICQMMICHFKLMAWIEEHFSREYPEIKSIQDIWDKDDLGGYQTQRYSKELNKVIIINDLTAISNDLKSIGLTDYDFKQQLTLFRTRRNNMKQQKEFYAIAQNGTNKFLAGYKNKEHALTFSASFTNDVRCALVFEKGDKESEEAIYNIAKAVGGRLVKIKAEYEITEEDGSELQEPVEGNEGYDPELLDSLFKKMLGL